jgi:hypothetical protein
MSLSVISFHWVAYHVIKCHIMHAISCSIMCHRTFPTSLLIKSGGKRGGGGHICLPRPSATALLSVQRQQVGAPTVPLAFIAKSGNGVNLGTFTSCHSCKFMSCHLCKFMSIHVFHGIVCQACHFMSFHVISCQFMSIYVNSCQFLPFMLFMSFHVIHANLFQFMPFFFINVISCHSCHSCQFMSFMSIHVIHVNSCQFMSFMSIHVIHVNSCHSC